MTTHDSSRGLDERILIFAPVGKDAPLTQEVLVRADLVGCVCPTSSNLCAEFLRGAAAILLTEEALEDPGIHELMDCLRSQPAWSDIPILLFADAIINQYQSVAIFHQHAAKCPVAHIVRISRVNLIPDRFGNNAKHSTTI